jgi:hypothetical protein
MAETSRREWKQDISAASDSGAPASDENSAAIKQRSGPTGSPTDVDRDDANTDALTTQVAASGVAESGDNILNSSTASKPGAAPAWEALDSHQREFAQIEVGWAVFSADGEQLGQVKEVGANWFAVPYGTNDELTMYVPITFIETTANLRVILNQPAGLLIDMKLNQPPGHSEGFQRTGGTEHSPWRGELAGEPVPEPVDSPAQEVSPASSLERRAQGGGRS